MSVQDLLRVVESLCRAVGAMLLLLAAVSIIDGLIGRHMALASFEQDGNRWLSSSETAGGGNTAVAVLRIERLGIEVPVFEGTGKTALRRGAGRIEGTTVPGQRGNIGIAGHRDGVFRPLENIQQNDVIELISHAGTQRFRVSEIRIVDALDVSVLEDVGAPRLTLVTCFPFRYVGFAPDRFIVHASSEDNARRDEPADRINQENSL